MVPRLKRKSVGKTEYLSGFHNGNSGSPPADIIREVDNHVGEEHQGDTIHLDFQKALTNH